MKLCGVSQPIFEEGAMETAYGSCQGGTRKLNNLLQKALMIDDRMRNKIHANNNRHHHGYG